MLPAIRAKVARILSSEGFSQVRIAKELGITQAMVSKYLSKYKPPEILEDIEGKIEAIAVSIAEMIKSDIEREEIIKTIERSFFKLLGDEKFCKAYEKYSGIPGKVCMELAIESGKKEVIEDLSRALEIILRDEKFAELIPEIRSNFAYSLPNPRDTNDVAAIPGRITVIKGKPYAMPPEFGVSKHTARLLVKVSKHNKDIRSVLNIRFGKDVEDAIKKAGLRVAYLPRELSSIEEIEDRIAEMFNGNEFDVVIDPGRHGVEPCVYIFGRNPMDVIVKLKKIEENL